MMTRGWATMVPVGVLVSLCAACATTEPVVIDFGGVTRSAPLPPIDGCTVTIASVVDERKSKEDLGLFRAQVVEGRQVLPWVQQALAPLSAPAVETGGRREGRAQARLLTASVNLAQLHVKHLPSTLAATILLRTTYQIDQEPPHAHQYRGADTKMNWQEALMGADWTGSAGSIRALFDDVLSDVVRRMHADIQQHCQGGQAKSGT